MPGLLPRHRRALGVTGSPEIRPFTADDATAVGRVYAHYVEHSVATFDLEAPAPADWVAKVVGITAAGWPFLVAVDGPDLVGFAYVSPWRARPAYAATVEDTVYLAPGRSGRGTVAAVAPEGRRRRRHPRHR